MIQSCKKDIEYRIIPLLRSFYSCQIALISSFHIFKTEKYFYSNNILPRAQYVKQKETEPVCKKSGKAPAQNFTSPTSANPEIQRESLGLYRALLLNHWSR